jgi:hypothetical protein
MGAHRSGIRISLFLPLAVVAGLLLGACSTFGLTPGSYGGTLVDTISVSGVGEAFGSPDIATVQLGVNVTNADIGDAVAESNAMMEAITAALVEMGVSAGDIQSTNFSVWPEDRYDPQTGQPTGERVYHVDSTVIAKIREIERAGEAIEVALDAGANNVYGLNFSIDDTAALESEARALAIDDAHERAAQLAEQFGVGLGEVVTISETTYGPPSTYSAVFQGVGGGEGAPPISEGTLALNVMVNVTYAIER